MQIKFEEAQPQFELALDFYKKTLSSIRAGAANPKLVEDIKIIAYGQSMPLNQVANVSAADATLLVIQPWDKSNIDAITKAILQSDLGINPSVDGDIIRLPLPVLTQERRQEYVKLMKKKMEDARVSVRQIRKEVMMGLEELESNGDITEDDLSAKKKTLQIMVDKYNLEIEDLGKQKEQELMKV